MPQVLSHCPSPRVLKRLEESEETIIKADLKQDEDAQIEALFKKAKEVKDQTMVKYLSKNQEETNVKASKIRIWLLRCRRLKVDNDTLEKD